MHKVVPGAPHRAAAEVTLKRLQSIAAQRQLTLDVGEIKDNPIEHLSESASESDRQPSELLARLYAHAAKRAPVVKGVAQRFEGTEAHSGPGSDLLALAYELGRRNQELTAQILDVLVNQGAAKWRENRAKRKHERAVRREAKRARHSNQQPTERG